MRITRHAVFETNSSSSHSISIATGTDLSNPINLILGASGLLPDRDGVLTLKGGEFGWGFDKYNDPETKANYVAVAFRNSPEHLSVLEVVLKEVTHAKEIKYSFGEHYDSPNWSYIDHQSEEDPGKAVDQLKQNFSKETLRDFIYNEKSWLFLGNDNSKPPPNFYDIQDTVYTDVLSLEGVQEVVQLKAGEKSDNQKLLEQLGVLWHYHPKNEYVAGRNYWGGSDDKGYSWSTWAMKDQDPPYDLGKQEIYPVIQEPEYEGRGKDRRFKGHKVLDRLTLKFSITPRV